MKLTKKLLKEMIEEEIQSMSESKPENLQVKDLLDSLRGALRRGDGFEDSLIAAFIKMIDAVAPNVSLQNQTRFVKLFKRMTELLKDFMSTPGATETEPTPQVQAAAAVAQKTNQ